jgi:hypothetical protein
MGNDGGVIARRARIEVFSRFWNQVQAREENVVNFFIARVRSAVVVARPGEVVLQKDGRF